MENYFRIETNVTILPDTKIIKAEALNNIYAADDLLEKTEERRQQILADAEAKYHSEKQRGYDEGIELAKQDKLNAINVANMRLAEFTKKIEASVGEIVQSILARVLGQFEKKEVLISLIENTIKDYTRSNKIRVMVKPEHAEYLNTHLERLIEDHPVIEFVEVVPDYSVDEGDCVVDTQSEMIFVSLEQQLTAIGEMMKEVSLQSSRV